MEVPLRDKRTLLHTQLLMLADVIVLKILVRQKEMHMALVAIVAKTDLNMKKIVKGRIILVIEAGTMEDKMMTDLKIKETGEKIPHKIMVTDMVLMMTMTNIMYEQRINSKMVTGPGITEDQMMKDFILMEIVLGMEDQTMVVTVLMIMAIGRDFMKGQVKTNMVSIETEPGITESQMMKDSILI
jgi:hypothetical protein